MDSVRLVRKRDGRLVDFDEARIADAIYKAALSVGGEDRFVAEELASVVTLFLEKTYSHGIASIEEVQDMVEKVLIETGHAQTAKAYILYRERRAKLREAARRPGKPAQGMLFESSHVRVLDAGGGRAGPLSRGVLARSIAAEADLPEATAEEVADVVVRRVDDLGIESVTGNLLSRLVDGELLSRGLFSAVKDRGGITLSRHRVESAIFPKEWNRRGTPTDRLGGEILRQHALEGLYGSDVATAHLSGRIAISGLRNPAGLYAACLSTEAVRTGGIPGVPGRLRPEAVACSRRFAAHLGRSLRRIAPHVTHGLSLGRMNLLMAPMLDGLSMEELREEAWHLLSELAELPEAEVELGLMPPAVLASHKALGPDGVPGRETYARFAGTALRFATALLEVRGTGSGLGPRSRLPRLAVILGDGALEDEGACSVVARAVRECLDREPVLFVLDRGDLPLLGTSRVRVRLEDATRLTDPTTFSVAVGARVAVNLPRAAYRSGGGNAAAFLREVEEAASLALTAVKTRARFLARCAVGPDGPLEFLARGRGGGPGLLDVEGATHSLSVLGLNEAVAFATGEELHESDEALKVGRRALATLAVLCRRMLGEGLDVGLDAEADAAPAARLADLDRAEFPGLEDRIPETYTPGVALRADAPVDAAMRLEMEGRLGMAARTTTVNLLVRSEEHPPPETVVALLRKTRSNTRVRQVLVGRESRGTGTRPSS